MSDDAQVKLLWDHYKQLSDEIDSADKLNYQIVGVVVAAFVALISAAFSKVTSESDRCCILLSLYIITITGGSFLRVARVRIWRIARYLEIFLEPKLELVKWQQRLNKCRAPDKMNDSLVKIESRLIFTLDLIAFALVTVTVAENQSYLGYFFFVLAFGLTVYSFFRMQTATRFERHGKWHAEYEESWTAVQANEIDTKYASHDAAADG